MSISDRGRRFAALFCVAALLAASALGAGVGPSGATTADDAIRFRQEFGLTSDSAYVNSISQLGLAAEGNEYPVPLTQPELDDLRQRRAAEGQIAAFESQLAAIPAFGGLFIDQTAGGVVDVAFVGGDDDAKPILQGLADLVTIRVRTVPFTAEQLASIHQAILGDREFHQSIGVIVREVETDIRTNQVRVGVSTLGDDVATTMQERYGAAVATYEAEPSVPSGCISRDNCPGPPLRAGIRLYDAGCTSGFIIRHNLDYGMLTAGHCANLGERGKRCAHHLSSPLSSPWFS